MLTCGCAHRRANVPLAKVDHSTGYYFHPGGRTNQSDDVLFALAFSGGGTRAAAFAYGVLEELRDTKLPGDGAHSLLNEVDVISSVSGGSVTAAAYGLYGDRVFDMLEPAFLKRNVQSSLVLQTLNPLHWPALWSSTYGRSELMADFYDRTLFHGATFDALRTNGGPFLVINGTDITTGTRFDFTQHSFDLICSDVSKYPLASAVAASSAVPGALTPITLKNFAGGCGCTAPDWIGAALQRDVGRISRRARVLLLDDGVEKPPARLEELPAGFRRDGVARWNGDPRVHHLRDARALPAQEIAHARVPLGFSVAEEVHPAAPAGRGAGCRVAGGRGPGAHRPTRFSSSMGRISPAGIPA